MLNVVTALVKKALSSIKIRTLVKKQGSDHHVFIINNTWVCKIAKTEKYQQKLIYEVRLLQALQLKLSTRIPNVEYYDPENIVLIYKKIPGIELTPELYASWNQEKQEQLARDIAHFLHELHHALSSIEITRCGLIQTNWPLFSALGSPESWVINFGCQELKNIFTWFIDLYKCEKNNLQQSFLVHNDLHSRNILVNPKTKKLTGIIDFSDAGIGDRAHDFRLLCSFDQSFLHRVIHEYNDLSKQPVRLEHVNLLYFATEFSRYLEKQKQGKFDELEVIKNRIVENKKIF